MPKDFILTREELPILLNILYTKDNWRLEIHPFLLRKNLFSVDLDDTVVIKRLVNTTQYSERLPQESFPDIIPQFTDIRSILIGSGFLKMINWDELIRKLDEIKAIDPLKGDRFTFIGMDSNSYINRIYSVLENSYRGGISNFFFVLSMVVSQELRSASQISKTQLDAFKKCEQYKKIGHILKNFSIKDSLIARIKSIGRVEFNKQKKKTRCLMNENLEIRTDIDNDLQIIDDFRDQVVKQNYNLLLISADKHFHDQGRGGGIVCIDFKIPIIKDLPEEFSGNWENLYDLLYLCSIYFGAIRIQGNQNSVHIYGLWRGKSQSDWDSESLKVQIGSKSIRRLLQQQINIINLQK